MLAGITSQGNCIQHPKILHHSRLFRGEASNFGPGASTTTALLLPLTVMVLTVGMLSGKEVGWHWLLAGIRSFTRIPSYSSTSPVLTT